VLDVRWTLAGGPGLDRYLAGHIGGARFVDLDADLAGPPGSGGRHPLPDLGRFAGAMARLGVCNDRPVVCYDDGSGLAAARAWWLLRYAGHGDVRLLDGGYAAWVAAGNPVETGAAGPEPGEPAPPAAADETGPPGDFTVTSPRTAVLDAGAIPAFVAAGHVLLDGRDRERYLGRVEPVDAVAGHIPGATNAPTGENVNPSGTFKRPDELRARFAALGVSEGRDVAVYCGSGVTAAHEVLALEVAGWRAALYPGSWSQWITDPDRPVAAGEERGPVGSS
jgi:thiosulfate/3-mercaptopyruvate sulfurtransferase